MSERNPREVVVGYYEEVWAKRQPHLIPSFFADDYRNNAGSRGVLSGPAGIRSNYDGLITSFPDIEMSLEEIIVEQDKVVVRYIMRGTHTGVFQGTPATGRKVEVPGIGIYRVSNGKIAESWVVRDSLVLLRQIGAVL